MKTEEILMKLQNNKEYIKCVRKKLRADKNFALLILTINTDFYYYLDENLKKDVDIFNFLISNPSLSRDTEWKLEKYHIDKIEQNEELKKRYTNMRLERLKECLIVNYSDKYPIACEKIANLSFETLNNILNDRYLYIIKRRFGFSSTDNLQKLASLEELADELHCTRERIRQLEYKSFRKIANYFEKESYNNREDISEKIILKSSIYKKNYYSSFYKL